jgi:hypothetical protein
LLAPLIALYDALLQLDDGETLPVLQKVRHSGRARASAGRESLKGIVAFTVDRLCALGTSPSEAHETVARVLTSEFVTPARGKFVTPARGSSLMTARTVRLWCEDVAADVGRHREAGQAFDFLQTVSAARCELNPSKELLLERLVQLVRRTRSGELPPNPPS